jgi:hypothetical protein
MSGGKKALSASGFQLSDFRDIRFVDPRDELPLLSFVQAPFVVA